MNCFLENEDCRSFLKRLYDLPTAEQFDYVFTVPPDFDEMGLDPADDAAISEWRELINQVAWRLSAPVRGKRAASITIALTDRKRRGVIVPKHSMTIQIMGNQDYDLRSHKIWVKSDKINLYRLNYLHLMTFIPKDKTPAPTKGQREFRYDVFHHRLDKYHGYPYGIPTALVKLFVEEHTEPGGKVVDCFSGSGTTALACAMSGRDFMGCELDRKTWLLSRQRLMEYHDSILGAT